MDNIDDVLADSLQRFANAETRYQTKREEKRVASPGETLALFGSVYHNIYDKYDPGLIVPSFFRINKDHSYTQVDVLRGTALTAFCACHPWDMRFGWYGIKYLTDMPGFPSKPFIRFVDGGEVLLSSLREMHSCVHVKVW